MHARDMRPISNFDQLRGQTIRVPLSQQPSETVVCVESTSFHEVQVDEQIAGELRFVYIY